MTSYILKIGFGPGMWQDFSGKLHNTHEAAAAEATPYGGIGLVTLRPYPIAFRVKKLRRISAEPRRPGVMTATTSSPLLRKRSTAIDR